MYKTNYMYTREVTLQEAQHFYEASVKCLQEGSPIKTPIAKTLTKLEPVLGEASKTLRKQLAEVVDKYDEEKKEPIYKEGKTLEDYMKVVEESSSNTISIEIYTVKPTESLIFPNGTRMRLIDYLEKGVNIPAGTALFLIDNYIK